MTRWLFLLTLLILWMFPLHIVDVGTPQEDWEELACLSSVVFREGNLEPLLAKRAILDVLLYRIEKNGSSCVVEALRPKQFSGFHAGMIERKFLTDYFVYSKMAEVCKECSHFVREDVQIGWTKKMEYRGQWGSHKFYLEK